VLGRLGQAGTHADVGIGNGDDPADGLDVAPVYLGRFGLAHEVAQEDAEEAIALPDREDGVRSDVMARQRAEIEGRPRHVGDALVERAGDGIVEQPLPETQALDAGRLWA